MQKESLITPRSEHRSLRWILIFDYTSSCRCFAALGHTIIYLVQTLKVFLFFSESRCREFKSRVWCKNTILCRPSLPENSKSCQTSRVIRHSVTPKALGLVNHSVFPGSMFLEDGYSTIVNPTSFSKTLFDWWLKFPSSLSCAACLLLAALQYL